MNSQAKEENENAPQGTRPREQNPREGVRAAAREVLDAAVAVGTAIHDLFREPPDSGPWPAGVRQAVAEARSYGPGEVAVMQDRWRDEPVLVVLYKAAGQAQARLVERVHVDTSAMTPGEAAAWPAATDSRSRVWTFAAGPDPAFQDR